MNDRAIIMLCILFHKGMANGGSEVSLLEWKFQTSKRGRLE